MGGGIIQLIAYGEQNIYLCGNPQITFFKAVYKRHSNFALENVINLPRGNIGFNSRLTFDIERKADLLGNSFLTFYLSFNDETGAKLTYEDLKKELCIEKSLSSLSKSIGYSLVEYIDIEIGGTRIDRHTGEYLAMKTNLINNFNKRFNHYLLSETVTPAPHIGENVFSIIIPLQFWFNENPGVFLPIVCLQHHDIKIILKINNVSKVIIPPKEPDRSNKYSLSYNPVSSITFEDLQLNCCYVYLDKEEQQKFANSNHEYLIEQVQILPVHEDENAGQDHNIIIPLNLNHPVEEILWSIHDYDDVAEAGPIWSGQKDRIKNAVIQLNGVDRFTMKEGSYFQTCQKLYHHNSINFNDYMNEMKFLITNEFHDYSFNDDRSLLPFSPIDTFMYSFSLFPFKYQPTGSCNFSNIDNAILKLTFNGNGGICKSTSNFGLNGFYISVYAVNYNILKIKNGMALLAYSN